MTLVNFTWQCGSCFLCVCCCCCCCLYGQQWSKYTRAKDDFPKNSNNGWRGEFHLHATEVVVVIVLSQEDFKRALITLKIALVSLVTGAICLKEIIPRIIVGFFIPVSSLKVFGHSIHSERRRIILENQYKLYRMTIIISWVFSFRVIQPIVRWHTFKILCLFSSVLVHHKNFSRQSVIKVPNQ